MFGYKKSSENRILLPADMICAFELYIFVFNKLFKTTKMR